MVISYEKGTITIVLEDDEIETADFIFSQVSANDLVRIQFEKMFNQRKLQQKEELKEQLFQNFTTAQAAQRVKG